MKVQQRTEGLYRDAPATCKNKKEGHLYFDTGALQDRIKEDRHRERSKCFMLTYHVANQIDIVAAFREQHEARVSFFAPLPPNVAVRKVPVSNRL